MFRIVSCCLLVLTPLRMSFAQTSNAARESQIWMVPQSKEMMPHFEQVRGRNVLYVDGEPFVALASETPWWNVVRGHERETELSIDFLYPAAAKMGLNAVKVPVKWSTVEPRKDVYDFSYVDHARSMAEANHLKLILDWFGHFGSDDGNIYTNLTAGEVVPDYIIQDEKTYPRAIDADGVVHHNSASYEYDQIVQREVKVFRALMRHIRDVDATTHTIIMLQVENEISVFGYDRTNRKLWRDHVPEATRNFQAHGFTDDLKYSAWRLSTHWMRPLTDAGAAAYPIPLELNYVGGSLENGVVGGAPGEDVATYLQKCPNLSFIGLNLYIDPASTTDQIRDALKAYKIGRNTPAITETNSGNDGVAPRVAYIAVGEYGAPLVSPWALNVSDAPYVTPEGRLANGAFALRDTYASLSKVLPQIAYYAGTDRMKVFMAATPGKKFSETQDINGTAVTVTGDGKESKAIVIHHSGNDFLIVGVDCSVIIQNKDFVWPSMQNLYVKRGHWIHDAWVEEGEPYYSVDQGRSTLRVALETPEAVAVSW